MATTDLTPPYAIESVIDRLVEGARQEFLMRRTRLEAG